MNDFKNLEKELKKRKWSRNKLGLEAKISPSSISQALNGKMPLFPNWKKRISEALEVSEAELFPENENIEEANNGK